MEKETGKNNFKLEWLYRLFWLRISKKNKSKSNRQNWSDLDFRSWPPDPNWSPPVSSWQLPVRRPPKQTRKTSADTLLLVRTKQRRRHHETLLCRPDKIFRCITTLTDNASNMKLARDTLAKRSGFKHIFIYGASCTHLEMC